MIEELARLPVQLGRNMTTFVEIAKNLPVKTHYEGRHGLAVALNGKTHAFAGLD